MDIRIEHLEVAFRDTKGQLVPILNVPEFHVEAGRQICLVGGSGSGKTTLLNVLAGITLPTKGSVSFGGTNICLLSESKRDAFRARHVGYVFQTFNLLQGLTALENVALPAVFAGKAKAESRRQAKALLERVGLAHRIDARPGTLSVGEQQRVAIARAVINEPTCVLADEPTANLDVSNGDEVLDILKEVTSRAGSILLLVTHEPRVQKHFETVMPLSEVTR